MSAGKNENSASSVRQTGKRRRIFYFNRKSCMAMVLSAAMLFTSVDCMSVHAEELADMVPPVSEEEKPDASGEGGITKEEPIDGPAVITSFQELSEEDSCIKLTGEKKALDEVLALMPETLTANVEAAASVSENTPEGDTKPGEGETEPGEGDQPGEGETRPGEEEQPGEGEEQPGEGDQLGEGEEQPGEGDQPGEGEEQPGEGDQPGEGETQPGEGDQPGEGEEQPGEGDQPGGGEAQPGEGDQPGGGETQPGEGDQPGGETEPGEGDQPGSGEAQPGEEDRPGAEDSGNGGGENGGADDGSGSDTGEGRQDGGSNEGESQSLAPDANDAAAAAKSRTLAAEGQRWRLLVETGENSDGSVGNEGDDGNEDGSNGSDSGAEGGNDGSESGADGSTSGSGEGGTDGSTDGSEGGADGSTGGSGEGGTGGSTDESAGGSNGSEGGADGSTGGSGEGGTDGSTDESAGGSNGSEGGADGSTGGSEGGTDGSTGGSGSEGGVDGSIGGNDGESGIEGGEGADGPETGEGENTPPGIKPGEGTDIPNEENPDAVPPVKGDAVETVEIPVTWSCETYETEEADSYTFVPEWDEKKWSLAESAKDTVPTIEVVYVAPESEVSTEEELVAAFAAGLRQIILQNDISLTKPLELPAKAKIELDGQGFSILRGKAETEDGSEGHEFTGVMIRMDGGDYTEDTYGRLTLKNVTVNGKTEADHAGAPAILDKGELILEKGAVVTNNYNYGTEPGDDEEGVKEILPYGGGIQVYGKLTVMEGSSITKNYAAERGGGVYLFAGSKLYLYADVIKGNSVGSVEGKEYGADLYAEEGSRIYFDPSIDMEQKGFYLCDGVIEDPQRPPTDPSRKELYIYINEDSGYSSVQIAELKDELRRMGYVVLEGRTDIDTTDMRNWYVYDHYDENLWVTQKNWEKVYGKSSKKRGYYPYKSREETYDPYKKGYYHFPSNEADIVTTIQDWLGNRNYGMSYRYLAQFEEHIYVREEEGRTMMTFVGYGENPHVDFMYYDPESDGEKVVDFDVDSAAIDLHTLNGNGFLINTGIDDNGNMSGYLLLYNYQSKGTAKFLALYRIDGKGAEQLHEGPLANVVQRVTAVDASKEWQSKMSVQIRVRPNKITVRQQPQSKGTDISKAEPILDYTIQDSGYSGFGPLVAYGSHACTSASSFTYSDLRMYYTNPQFEGPSVLSPVDKADFTQEGMQKYFIDLFGSSGLNFNATMDMGDPYHEYMKMMQTEGIALITDRKTPFEPYLGKANGSDSNLYELSEGGTLPEPKELAERIHNSISTKSTTDLQEKVEDGKLTEANPKMSVGNIWLRSAETGEQIRESLYGNTFADGGYEIQVIDDEDITYYHGAQGVTYEILKPKAKDYISLGKGNATSGFAFTVGKDKSAWPAGLYTVRQKIGKSNIYGYAYFTLEWRDPPIPVYNITLTVKKDDEVWTGHGKDFMLQPAAEGSLINFSEMVKAGTYSVIELVREGALTENVDTGVSVSVKNTDKNVDVDYYTVTFYDGMPSPDREPEKYGDDTEQKQQIVLKEKGRAFAPPAPEGNNCTFTGWVTAEGNTFNFDSGINEAAKVYAKWAYPVGVEVTARKDDDVWDASEKKFMLRPEGSDELIELSEDVPLGSYVVYDVTGLNEGDSPTEDRNTGIPVVITEKDAETPGTIKKVAVDYYTVTFYDGPEGENPKPYGNDTDQAQQIILKDSGRITRPQTDPVREGYTFEKWMTEDGGEKFDFENTPVTAVTNIYAGWNKIVVPTYKVTIEVYRDDTKWENHPRKLVIREDGGTSFINDLDQVENGTYSIYDVTGINPDYYWSKAVDTGKNVEVNGVDTDVDVTVKDEAARARIDYYTVTFYDGTAAYGTDTPQKPMVVLKGKKAAKPEEPEKTDYIFTDWKTGDGGSTPHDFEQAVTHKTDIYAGWTPVPVYTITATAGKGGQISPSGAVSVNEGGEQAFTITPNKGYHIKTVQADETDVTDSVIGTDNSYTFRDVRADHTITASFAANKKPGAAQEPDDKKKSDRTPDDGGGEEMQTVTVWQEAAPKAENAQTEDMPGGKEPKTADPTPVEIYATIAMIAGLTYLLLYFMEEGRGMSEREKEVFVAAFIRWAKKGGRFRRYCAIVFIFCLLVYYHGIGKKIGRNELEREYLKQVL